MAVGADSASAWWLRPGSCKNYERPICCPRNNMPPGDTCVPGNDSSAGSCSGPSCNVALAGGISVNPASGNLDLGGGARLGFPDCGGGPCVNLSHNSQQDPGQDYNLGPGWQLTHHMGLDSPDANRKVQRNADGTPYTFTRNSDGSYTPEPGDHAKLQRILFMGSYINQLTVPDGKRFWFDVNNGKLSVALDRNGNSQVMAYDGSGRLSTIRQNDNANRKLTLSYDANGRISSISDFLDTPRTVQLSYDAGGRLETVIDPTGAVTTYGYDTSDRITSVTTNNHTWSYGYDNRSRVSSVTDPLNHTVTYAYVNHPASDRIKTTTIADPNNHTAVYEYDTNGRLIKLTDALGHYRQFGYDSAWNRITMTNEGNQTWHYGYNLYGDMTSVTDPLNHVTQYQYGYNTADDHLLKKIIDPLNHQTNFTYDTNGNLLTVTDPNSNTTTYTYNANGTLHTVKDARSNTTTYGYTSSYSTAYLTSITDPLQHTTSFTYDAVGNRTSVTDARNDTTYYAYDNNGRVTQITNPDSTTRTSAYNCCNLTSTTDENGKTTTYHYDNAERLSYVTDAENHETHYAYDDAANLTSVTDANSHATSYTYDDANRLTRIDYPDSTYETFAYYDTGALETRTDGNGVTTTYDRDELDRVTAIDYPGTASDVTFTYDAEGRVTRMQDTNCDTYYRYDVWGITKYDQLIAVQRKYGSMDNYRSTSYTYDANYNRTGMVDGAGNGTTYTYDANNQLATIVRLGTTTFTYDAVGNRTQKSLPNGAHTDYTCNARNLLTSLENHNQSGALISSYAYSHDNVGNRTTMTEANGDVTSYTYDNVYRLTDETKRDSGNNVLYRYQYTYDGVGNRLTETNTGQITYTYDSNNKLTQLVGPGGTTTFGYDNNGNMTSMVQPGPVTTTYGYGYENRLVSVANPSYTAAYTYAPDGLRLRIQESNAQYPDRWLQYDGVRPVLEGTLDTEGAFTTLNKYVWEGNSYYDPLVYSQIGGAWRYYMYDGLGSTRQLMLHASPYTVTDTYQYEAFGNLIASTGTTPNPYKYVGSLGYYQTGSSLMHLGARFYMPEVGRFAQRDPLDETSGKWGQVMNFAGNRLASVTNPSYTAAYTYAEDGLRLRAQESNAQYTDRWLQYDGVRPVLEGTLDSQGVFATLNKYVWEGNSYYSPLMYSLIGGAWRYHLYDGLGSTRQLMLHTDQSITDTYSYEAFGNLLASTGTTPNPYKYVGSLGYYQTGSSLMHLGARYYMPEVGRFSTPGSPYAYAGNSPNNVVQADGAWEPILGWFKHFLLGVPPAHPRDSEGDPIDRAGDSWDPHHWPQECESGAETFNQRCQDACVKALDPNGRHPGRYDDRCRKFCSKVGGNDCGALKAKCKHLGRDLGANHPETKLCWKIYKKMCTN